MEWIKKLHIPLCQPQRVPVKTLINQIDVSSSDKRIVEKHVASIRLVSILDENTIKIRSYKDENFSYQSIYVLYIDLKINNSLITLSNLIHSAFPEPTVLIYRCKDLSYISTANKRINKVDTEKSVIEEIAFVSIPQNIDATYLNLEGLTGSNLKEYYENFVNWIYKLKIFQITDVFPQINLEFKIFINEYDTLSQGINKLKEQYKTASMLAEKLKIDDEIFDKESMQKNIISRLKGDQING
ncbi:MAG: DUF4391 domain-containing protein [Bacilli bacterium]|nr:DUF4391 domain-containing protein [Bacilli bacterium]